MAYLEKLIHCPVLVHPGWPKAASTFVQENILMHAPQTLYLGRPLPKFLKKGTIQHEMALVYEQIQGFVYVYDECVFACKKEQLAADIARRLERLMAQIGKENIAQIIVSEEGFTNLAANTKVDRARKAERLKELFGAAKIWFVIRKQDKLLESYYGACLRKANKRLPYCSFAEFIKIAYEMDSYGWEMIEDSRGRIRERYVNILSSADFGHPLWVCHYDEVVRCYESFFGKENIYISLFEDLTADPAGECARISEQSGFSIPVPQRVEHTRNTAMPNRYETLHFYMRKYVLFDYAFRAARRLGVEKAVTGRVPYMAEKLPLDWPAGLKERVLDVYRAGNAALAERYELDLGGKGYPC